MSRAGTVAIRKTEEKDIPFIAGCLQGCDKRFAEQCGYGSRYFTFPVNEEQIRFFQRGREGTSMFFTVTENDTPAGSLELMLHPEEKRGALARFLIAGSCRDRGIGTEALRLLSEYAFDTLGFETLTLTVFDFNHGALACYKKAGFTETGRQTRDNGLVAILMTKRNGSFGD